MDRDVKALINDYLAPEQPDDCREASRELLAKALKASGPVTHRGYVVSLGPEGTIAMEAAPAEEEPPADPDEPATEPANPTISES